VSPLAFVAHLTRLGDADTTAGAVVRFTGHCLHCTIFGTSFFAPRRRLELVKNTPGGIDFLNVSVYTNINEAGRAADCNQQGEETMFKVTYKNGWVSYYSEKPSSFSSDMRWTLSWRLYEMSPAGWVQIDGQL
jgi:hypothetical protein